MIARPEIPWTGSQGYQHGAFLRGSRSGVYGSGVGRGTSPSTAGVTDPEEQPLAQMRRDPRRGDLGHGDRAFKGASKQAVGQTIVDVRAATAGAIVFVGAAGDFVSVLLEVRTLFPRIE